MSRLIIFELTKIWGRRRFVILALVIFMMNIFMLWYTNLSDGAKPELSAYKALQRDIVSMPESKKQDYIGKLHEDIQGLSVVWDMLMLRKMSGEMGEALAEQEREKHPGVFEHYYKIFQEGGYLKYTDSFEQEAALINEVYEEMEKVFAYHDYLEAIENSGSCLGGISIFGEDTQDTYSSRNIGKSVKDYKSLYDVKITFFPSKGIAGAMKNSFSDIFLVLSVFLFGSSLMNEEKSKRLFLITRAAFYGRGNSMAAKLMALAIHCITAAIVIYSSNLLYFSWTTGIGKLSRSIQSAAPFMESNYNISVLTYILLSILTKGTVIFIIGCTILIVSIAAKQSFWPWLAGGILLAGSLILYECIPAWSVWNWLKYLNLIGLLKTENIYGSYLNFNFGGWPVSRSCASVWMLLILTAAGVSGAVILFLKCSNLEYKQIGEVRPPLPLNRGIHSSLFGHEGYKILIMNRALIVLMLFAVLLGYQRLSAEYHLSVRESYYRSIMLQLEGPLTPEKEVLIAGEEQRYDTAFAEIERIDELAEKGELDAKSAESMKSPYYSEVIFYPAFQRVMLQYEWLKAEGGSFIYDTGYLYLLGVIDDGYRMDFILLTVCFILAFSHTMTVEYEKGLWRLLNATARGRSMIVKRKVAVCLLTALAVSLVPWVCRGIRLNQTYPLHGIMAPINVMTDFRCISIRIPVLVVLLAAAGLWLLESAVTALIVLALSGRLKSHLQVLFISAAILLIPLILIEMGLLPQSLQLPVHML